MEFDEVVKKRRSIRKYIGKEISLDKLILILESAKNSPSSGNLQDFRFIIVNDKDKKNKIAEACLKQDWMNSAPIFIVVCSDIKRLKEYYKSKADEYSLQNAAAAAMIISLKSTDLGLSSCWVSVFDQKEISQILRIKEGVIPQIILTLGYEYTLPLKPPQKISLDKILFFNKYGDKTTNVKNWGKENYLNKIKKLIKKSFSF